MFVDDLIALDVDRDGFVDLVGVEENRDRVEVWRGNGDGTFGPTLVSQAGNGAISIATADFNSDEIPDVVTANRQGRDVTVLLGNDDGTFGDAASYPAGGGPVSIATGSFNSDSAPDVVVANEAGDDVRVYFGVGRGVLVPGNFFEAADAPSDVAVTDLNRDGHADIVVAAAEDDELVVLLGLGQGQFQAPVRTTTRHGPSDLIIADLDGDTVLDAAAVTGTVAEVLPGLGDGTFADATAHSVFGTGNAVATADFDQNGAADLVIGLDGASGLGILYGTGDGEFLPVRNFLRGRFVKSVVATDLNGDGRVDVAVATGGDDINVLINAPEPSLRMLGPATVIRLLGIRGRSCRVNGATAKSLVTNFG